jgi:DNA-binding XRE family transcriptional regulator
MRITMKSARVNAGLTQRETAEKLGVTPVTYYYWETGRVAMRPGQFRAFCEVVGMTTHDIFLPRELRLTALDRKRGEDGTVS